jgi:hypothetical protein
MTTTVARLLKLRETVRAQGDKGLEREIEWELQRAGYVEPAAATDSEVIPSASPPVETVDGPLPMERSVPPKVPRRQVG